MRIHPNEYSHFQNKTTLIEANLVILGKPPYTEPTKATLVRSRFGRFGTYSKVCLLHCTLKKQVRLNLKLLGNEPETEPTHQFSPEIEYMRYVSDYFNQFSLIRIAFVKREPKLFLNVMRVSSYREQ